MSNDNRVQGEALESALDLLHAYYRNHELAVVDHNGTMARRAGKRWVPLPSKPDYEGHLWGTGRRVLFDAKSTTRDRYVHHKRSAHQTQALWEAWLTGALAFLLVEQEYEPGLRRAFLLWPQPWWEDDRGFTSPLGDDEEQGVVPVPAWPRIQGAFGYVPDWLLLLEQLGLALPRTR